MKKQNERRIEREAQVGWIALGAIRVSSLSQRRFNKAWADTILANFKPEEIGKPTVNRRNGHYYCLDGQHRVDALRRFLGDGWESQQIQCEVYDGLSEQEEADKFDLLNSVKAVNALCRFKVRVAAGREAETEINKVVIAEGLRVSHDRTPGSIQAVGTLCELYRRSNAPTLGRTLRIVRDSYGDAGLDAAVIGGIGELCQRYNGQLVDSVAVEKLSHAHGGVSGLLSKAELLRKQTGNSKRQCVAAAAVDIINSHRGGKKLPSWWKTTDAKGTP